MKTRNILLTITVALLMMYTIVTFVSRRKIISYSINGCNIAVHRDWPTYGLPLAELSAIRYFLSSNEIDKALVFLDQCILLAKTDALERVKHCSPSDRLLILEALKQVNRQEGACGYSIEIPPKSTNTFYETVAPHNP